MGLVSLSAVRQRWMMAKGLFPAVRHSIEGNATLNGPNEACAAGSLAASSRLWPTDTVSRPSSRLTKTTHVALPRQTRVALSAASLLPSIRQQFAAAVELWALTTIGWVAAWAPSVATTRVANARASRVGTRDVCRVFLIPTS